IAYNVLKYGRDYRHSALKTRQMEAAAGLGYPGATLGLPEAIAGRVALVFSTLFVAPKSTNHMLPEDGVVEEYDTPQEAYRLALKQIDYYHRLADESPRVSLIQNRADLDGVLKTWEPDKKVTERRQGLVILMEGADPIIEPKQFEEWYERGVRIVGPAWEETRYTAGTGKPGRLTKLGRELLEVMASFGAILDLSHMAEDAFLEAVDLYSGTIIASHSNPRRFRNSDRHLSDDMIRRLVERDGVMGIVLYNRFLSDTWDKTRPKHEITLKTVADAVDHVCQVAGSAAHVGLGSDFDGGFGVEQIPHEFDTVGDLWRVGDVLRQRGYSETDIEAVLAGNMLRKVKEVLK
ncbi:MAG TPA: membrane dipeptidase, partial [Phototrophicaceae bacterium]|nr:membrane dipeptidase [Phototrophicaceae bacterium]